MNMKQGKTAIRLGSDSQGSIVIYRTIRGFKETHTTNARLDLTIQYGKISYSQVRLVNGMPETVKSTMRVWRIWAIVDKTREIRTQWTPLVSPLDMLCEIHSMGISVYA